MRGVNCWPVAAISLLTYCAVAAAADRRARLAVIAPDDPVHIQSLRALLPAVELATQVVRRPDGLLPGWDITLKSMDSNCSSTDGPLAAIDVFKSTDAFIGPVCDYVIAPVGRYAGRWRVPVITAGGQADHFTYKTEYPTLTRLMGSYGSVSAAMREILHDFGWSIAGLLYHNYGVNSKKGFSKCHFILGPVFLMLGQSSVHRSFNESATAHEFRELLLLISKSARIVVLCAEPEMVREILLVAEELQMIDSGEYVFFNIELYNDKVKHRPWYQESDTPERNERAKKAFTAVLTVTAHTPDNPAYRNFSDEVKALALKERNFTFHAEPVSTFVTAFYDAVLLYALALNETLAAGGNQSDGVALTKRMWNRTFKGITGDVNINANGDRITDYSLLDLDPESGEFKIVATYIGVQKKLEYVPGTSIHWAGGRTTPPKDTPECGFDGSLCDRDMPVYAILSIVLSSFVVILAIASVFIYRYF